MTRLSISRIFQASPDRVFDAWLDPASVGGWLFATDGGVMERVEWDARVGGAFVIAERRGDVLAEHFGEFLAIDRPRRLVFSFATSRTEPPTEVTVIFRAVRQGCEVTLSHDLAPEWASYAERVQRGWWSILERLALDIETLAA